MPLAMAIHRFGLANLRSEPRTPEPLGEGQVRVAIRMVSLNHRDLLVLRGTYGNGLTLPLIPCSDGAGEILEVGAGVTGVTVGDRVCTHMVPDWHDGRLEPRHQPLDVGASKSRQKRRHSLERTPKHRAAREIPYGQAEILQQPEHLTPRVVPVRERFGNEVVQLVVRLPRGTADQVCDDEHRGGDPLALEHRQRLLVDIAIPVVEGDRSDWILERRPVEQMIAD